MTTKFAVVNFGPGVIKVTPVGSAGPIPALAQTVQAGETSLGIRYVYPGYTYIVEEVSG